MSPQYRLTHNAVQTRTRQQRGWARCVASGAAIIAAIGLSGAGSVQDAEPESQQSSIKLGMSTVLSGPAADLGQNMRLGVEAAIQEINRSGGIQGRPLELVVLDDGYEPERAAPNSHSLIDDEHVLAIIGNVGTPTAVATLPIMLEHETLFFGAFTGAGILRKDPPDRYVINFRASYAQETAAMVDALINRAGLDPQEIGFFTQQDAYGDAGFEGGVAALKTHGFIDERAIPHGRYKRNTLSIENGLADIMQSPIECKAIIMVGAYAPCAKFIRMAREYGLDPIFLNVSFVGAASLAKEIHDVEADVIVTQVVPPPSSGEPVIGSYREAIRAIDPDAAISYGSLEGYLAMRVFERGIRSIDREINRESIIDAIESLGEFSLGLGMEMSLSPTDHQASDRVWSSRILDGRVLPMDWSEFEKHRTLVQEAAGDE